MTFRDIEFLYEIGSLRNVERGWRQHLALPCANNLEHSFRVAFIALNLAKREGVSSDEKILKMALVHDLPEARTSDLSYVQKVYVTADEQRAARDMFDKTLLGESWLPILHEYEERKTIEAQLVKDADNLDIDLESRELAEQGSQLPDKWKTFRKKIRDEKLYTKSAKEFWELAQTVDVASWHMIANKWLKQPNAGK